jgi:predicted component of viral defense system (DUF524 family)
MQRINGKHIYNKNKSEFALKFEHKYKKSCYSPDS